MKTISLFPTYGTLGKIFNENIFATTHLNSGLPKIAKPLIAKQFSKILKQIEPSNIKVGKTGQYNTRARAKIYKDFDYMFILYKSTSEEFVSIIEDSFIKHAKKKYPKLCVNIKQGSAGVMKTKNGFYYVYLALVI